MAHTALLWEAAATGKCFCHRVWVLGCFQEGLGEGTGSLCAGSISGSVLQNIQEQTSSVLHGGGGGRGVSK